jgi:DNA circularisation protein N-terminus
MPTYWDSLPPCSFGGINFPVESSRIEGGQRDHVHEYPHTPGGAPELLGRKLYTFHVTSKFDVHFADEGSYPGLYPMDLGSLLAMFEEGSTQNLRLSQMGASVPAYAVSWTREQSAKCRSGETVSIVFREDTTEQFLFASMVNTAGTMEFSGQDLGAQLASVQSQLSDNTMNFFTQLASIVSNVVAWGNQLEGAFTSQYYDAVAACQTICGDLDVQPDLQVPLAFPVVNALHDVWQAAIKLSQQNTKSGVPLQQYVNPATQSIGLVCAAIYNGDTSRISDLLALNAITNPMSIRAGTKINYFPLS